MIHTRSFHEATNTTRASIVALCRTISRCAATYTDRQSMTTLSDLSDRYSVPCHTTLQTIFKMQEFYNISSCWKLSQAGGKWRRTRSTLPQDQPPLTVRSCFSPSWLNAKANSSNLESRSPGSSRTAIGGFSIHVDLHVILRLMQEGAYANRFLRGGYCIVPYWYLV